MTELTSNTNSQFKTFLGLTESKGIKSEKMFLLSGSALVREFLQKPGLQIHAEIVMEGLTPLTTKESGARIFKLSKALFEEIDVVGTKFNILVLSLPEVKPWTPALTKSGMTLVTPLGDPGNLGAVIRSAEAFGASQVLLLSEAAHPFLPKSVKASSGSSLRMPLYRGPSLKEFVQTEEVTSRLVGLDMKGIPIKKFEWPQHPYLLVGEEGAGLSGQRIRSISIPMKNVESLNGTIAASIALYEYSQK